MINFLIFGLPRSGTNLVHYMVSNKNNISKETKIIGDMKWKHSKPHIFPEVDKTILIYKPLFCWLYSIRQYNGPTLNWYKCNGINLHDVKEASFYYYNYYYNGIRQSKGIILLNWADSINFPKKFISQLRTHFTDIKSIPTQKMNTERGLTQTTFDSEFFKRKKYLDSFTSKEIDFIEKEYSELDINGQLY